MDVLVIGGGVIGCSIAYYLRCAGASVTLVERGRIGSGASSAAAGMLAPLAESPTPGPFFRLALLGLRSFLTEARTLIDESGIDFELRLDGILRVAESPGEAAHLGGLASSQTDSGLDAEWLGQDELAALEPQLAPGLIGALLTEQEGHVNPMRLTAALASAAANRGARLLEGRNIESLQREGRRIVAVRGAGESIAPDHIVLAGGAWSAGFAEEAGITAPVAPVRGQMLALEQTPPPISHIVYSQNGYLVPKADGSVFVGATEEPDAGFDNRVTAAGLSWLLGAATRLVPALAGAAYLRSWAGLRPCAPDRLPIIGPAPGLDNVSLATAHFRNGILLSLVTGRLMATYLTTGVLPNELHDFTPSRFTSPNRS